MDETKDTKGLSSETPGQASKGSEGNTSDTEAKTYNEEQVEGIVAKAKSDALATAGRTATALEQREAAVKAREDANKAEQERRDAAELAEAQKDPDRLAVYQSKQAEGQRARSLDERETNLARDKAEHEAEIRAAREETLALEIGKIAQAEGVDPVELKDTMKDLNLTTVEQAKSVAKRLNKKPEEPADKKKTHDSLVTSGRSKDLSGKSPMQLAQEAYEK